MNTRKFIDYKGRKFGRLLTLRYVGNNAAGDRLWEFKCDCGKIIKRKMTLVFCGDRDGEVVSCGCYQREVIPVINKTHGFSKSKSEYRVWRGMKRRCLVKGTPSYERYGGRGIKVCDRWINSFENFYYDMGDRPSSKHSLDRIDNNGDYEPTNCRWATKKEQSNNVRTNNWIEYNGIKMTLSQWSSYFRVTPTTLKSMLIRKTINDAYMYYKIKNNLTDIHESYAANYNNS